MLYILYVCIIHTENTDLRFRFNYQCQLLSNGRENTTFFVNVMYVHRNSEVNLLVEHLCTLSTP